MEQTELEKRTLQLAQERAQLEKEKTELRQQMFQLAQERSQMAALAGVPILFRILDLSLPANVAKFEPQPVQLPDSHPFKASMLSAQVMGKFADPTQPDFLLTEMFKPMDERFESLGVGEDELVEQGAVDPDDLKALVLVSAPGMGKTLYTYKLASREPTLLFVCSPRGKAGSGDMELIIRKAEWKERDDKEGAAEFMRQNMLKAVAFRMRVYKKCVDKYGAAFQPRHWAMAQLYPEQIFGSDLFMSFQEMAVKDDEGVLTQATSLPPFHRIVIDEVQAMDDTIQEYYPNQGKLSRSFFAPFVEALAPLQSRLLICDTGLSAANTYKTTDSLANENRALVGLSKHFAKDQVLQILESWGVPTSHARKWAPTFVGRPQHAAFLAAALVKDPTLQDAHMELEITAAVEWLWLGIRITRIIAERNLHRKPDSGGWFCILSNLLRDAALDWALGRQGFLFAKAVLVVKYGVASLAKVEDKTRCVMREPLLIETILGKDPEECLDFRRLRYDPHFDHYLGLKMPTLGGDISELLNLQPEAILDATFQRQWQFPSVDYTRKLGFRAKDGGEAAWLKKALESPTPPNTVCFPGKAMGPDVMVCLHDKNNPKDRLVVLVQAKPEKASTCEAFRALEHLYSKHRNVASGDGERLVKKARTGRTLQAAKALEESKRVVDGLLATHQVVRLVVQPLNGSCRDHVEQHGNFVNVVLDDRNLGVFPCLEDGLKELERSCA